MGMSIITFDIMFFLSNILFMTLFSSGSSLVNFSFFVNLSLITTLLYLIFKNKNNYFDLVVGTFYYIFFFFAPYLQTFFRHYPNTMPFNEKLIVRTNLLLFLFLFFYIFFKFCIPLRFKKFTTMKLANYKPSDFTAKTILLISILVVIVFAGYLKSSTFIGGGIHLAEERSLIFIIDKVLFNLPIFVVFYFLSKFLSKKHVKPREYLLLLASLFTLFLIRNPFNTKRNMLGPLYLSIFLGIIYSRKKPRLIFIFLFLLSVFLLIYPGVKVFTNTTIGFNLFWKDKSLIISNFFAYVKVFKSTITSLDFDAWGMVMGTIAYVDNQGITLGKQLLGVLLFFIPRGIWSAKPVGSGQVVGTWLMSHYQMWFYQISNPLPSEGYINFGLPGIIFFAFVLSRIGLIVDRMIVGSSYMKFVGIFISLYLFYLLRGDLISCYAYLVGIIVAILILPFFLDKFMKRGQSLQVVNKTSDTGKEKLKNLKRRI